MSADRNSQEGVGFTTKQKMMTGGVVVILLVLVWQVYGLVSGGGENPTPAPIVKNNQQAATKPPGQMTAAMPGPNANRMMPSTPANNFNNQNQTMQNGSPAGAPQTVPKEAQGMSIADVLKKQKDQQEKYLTTINELQMLKLQRDIAETNQAISAAKLATATAEKNIGDLFVKPAPPPPTPASSYGPGLVIPATATGSSSSPTGQQPADVGPIPYVVISVSMQMNKWTAVLGASGKLYNVSTGDVMSDGWVVGSISREGVVLKKGGVSKKVSLIPVI